MSMRESVCPDGLSTCCCLCACVSLHRSTRWGFWQRVPILMYMFGGCLLLLFWADVHYLEIWPLSRQKQEAQKQEGSVFFFPVSVTHETSSIGFQGEESARGIENRLKWSIDVPRIVTSFDYHGSIHVNHFKIKTHYEGTSTKQTTVSVTPLSLNTGDLEVAASKLKLILAYQRLYALPRAYNSQQVILYQWDLKMPRYIQFITDFKAIKMIYWFMIVFARCLNISPEKQSIKCAFSVMLLLNLSLDRVRLCDVEPLCFQANRGSDRSYFCIKNSGEKNEIY